VSERLDVLCFIDTLCVFCYVADARFKQVRTDFAGKVDMSYHFISVYGDVRRRLDRSGKSDAEYGANVRDIGDRFDHVQIHPDIFRKSVPSSSMPSHLYLRAVKLMEDTGRLEAGDGESPFLRMMWEVRQAFFRDLVDISKREQLDMIAERLGIPVDDVHEEISSGRAYAELSHDAELQREHKVPVSPSLVLNEGRQLLNGNVGYRVIEANIRELLNKRHDEMSWC